MLLTLGIGTAWAETVEFTPTNCTSWTTAQEAQSQTINGITLHTTKGANTSNQLRLYASNTHTISSTVGNITSIVFTCTANGTSNYGPGKMSGDGYVASTGKTGEWTGNATEVVLTGGQSRCTSILVTYTPSAGGDDSGSTTPVALSAPANLQATNIAETSATLSWNTVANATGYTVTINGSTQEVTTASYEATGLTAETAYEWSVLAKGDGTNFTNSTAATATFTTLAAQTGGEEGDSNKVTYDFTNINGFATWTTSYSKREVTYSDALVTFASATRQTSTINNQPVTKGQEVSLVMTDGSNLSTVEWVCTQWGSKAQTITLHYSTNGGNTWTKTDITSTNFTIASDNLPAGTDAVKITFSSTSNQVGITSCTIKKVEAAAETAASEPIFSLPAGTYESEQTLTLTCPTADAVIYYSTDGVTFNVYSAPITLNQTTTVKAYAAKTGLDNSQTLEYTYTFVAPADVVLDFTTNTWGLPEGNGNKVTTEASYTDGTYTVSVAGTNGHYFDSDNLITGKQDAYIILPIFDKPIVKVVCEAVASGSGSVQFNLFVNAEAVSTAVTSCKIDQTFLIAEDKQAANVAHVIKVTNANNLRVSKIKIYLGEAPAVEKPEISGKENFLNSTDVTITCPTSAATIYYTTNGDAPDNTSTQYSAPFSINATSTVKAIAYDANGNASKVVEMTFTKHELVNVATAMALEEGKVAFFDEFEVVKVVKGKGYIYIKDNSGHGLIFDYDLDEALNDGDRVKGFVGISSPYKSLPEHKVYNVTASDLTITIGTPAEPYDFTNTAIAEDHLNKYVVFKGVEMTADVDVATHPTLTIGGNSVNFRNQLGMSKTLENGKTYDVYAFVAIYNTTLQYYFYQALEEGEQSKTYTVTYNAGGATGTVPVDNSQYIEGAQVFLQSAKDLSYEGYNYNGWKVTDEDGNEISIADNKFNMPASNVTVTAQWEKIKERMDFSAGYWVLVTDASELNADDYVVVAAANLDVAMKSYESGNYCTHMAVTKNSNVFLEWQKDLGVFQLAKDNENYTFKDVNTNQYLYAAGTGSNNYLKAADEIPAEAEAVKPYIWTITIEDGVTTVKATSENRNTLKYNKTSGQERFSCYASGQEDVALYKYFETLPTYTVSATANPAEGGNVTGAATYELGATVTLTATANEGYVFVNWRKGEETVSSDAVYTFTATENVTLVANFEVSTPPTPTPDYTRTVTGKYGTICLPNASASTTGAYFYRVAGKGTENGKNAVYLESVDALEAGVPYIFEATAGTITVTYQGTPVAEAGTANGLVGTFTDETVVPDGGYILYGDKFCTHDDSSNPNKVNANRAYLDMDAVKGDAPVQMPGRRYIGMSVQGENGETGFENITAPADKAVKAIINGQLIIIRDGEMYNAMGVRL